MAIRPSLQKPLLCPGCARPNYLEKNQANHSNYSLLTFNQKIQPGYTSLAILPV